MFGLTGMIAVDNGDAVFYNKGYEMIRCRCR